PTGVQKRLADSEQKIYDAIARRFIAAFYPDCLVAKTTVIGEANAVKFKATGREILEEGWRVLFPKPAVGSDKKKADEPQLLPQFKAGESGPHKPSLVEKQTQPPKYFTEATLLRAMETAGKAVEDEQLRDLMKANGIGRPSTRAAIIETLVRRKYVERKRKRLYATDLGVRLIDTIQHELLKSAELTGQWEKRLREIEAGEYSAAQFIEEMKKMVGALVEEVKAAPVKTKFEPFFDPKKIKRPASKAAPKTTPKKPLPAADILARQSCPRCFKGKLLKGKTAYGCSRWKEGCDFRLPFEFGGRPIPEKQLLRLMKHGATIPLKGFVVAGKKVNGRLRFGPSGQLFLEEKDKAPTPKKPAKKAPEKTAPDRLVCPKCGKGQVMKGKTAYGCSRWASGCDYRVTFDDVRQKAGNRPLTKALLWRILREE
ncbi:MAG: type IA DNA topoisomerase, partial [Bacteroidetes bacterium]